MTGRCAHLARLTALAVLLVALGACARGCTSRRPPIHPVPNMDDQPRYEAQAASAFFADGAAMQKPVEGTVARGELELYLNRELATGLAEDGRPVTEMPISVTDAVLARGEERYGIYCTPCHGDRADGRGVLRERAGVQTANLLEDRFRAYPVGRIFDVVSNGFGLMPSYRYPIPPEDRWAIIAWVRKLQREVGPMPPLNLEAPNAAPATAAAPATGAAEGSGGSGESGEETPS
jgi:mono/diheme cytochrome c family protein